MQLLALRVAARWSWMIPPLVGDLLAHTVQQQHHQPQQQQSPQQQESNSTNQHYKPLHHDTGNQHPTGNDSGNGRNDADGDDDNATRFGFDGASFALAALTPRVDAGALISRLLVPPQARGGVR